MPCDSLMASDASPLPSHDESVRRAVGVQDRQARERHRTIVVGVLVVVRDVEFLLVQRVTQRHAELFRERHARRSWPPVTRFS